MKVISRVILKVISRVILKVILKAFSRAIYTDISGGYFQGLLGKNGSRATLGLFLRLS